MFSKRTNWNLETNRLTATLAAHRAAGKPLLDLTISNPTECGFRYDSQTIREALSSPAVMRYEPNPKGIETARQAVVNYYQQRSASVDLESVFLTVSTSESYSFAFRLLCNPGDEVLVPCPSYPLLDFLADILDVKLVRYPLIYDHGWQIDFHSLKKSLTPRTHAVIVIHPNNPTGNYLKLTELEQLHHICADAEIALIADEVFFDFHFSCEQSASLAANKNVLTFTVSGLSKISGLPQVKLAWLVVSGPERPKQQAVGRLEVIADTYLSVNAPAQLALPTLLDQRSAFHNQVLHRLNHNLAELDSQLARQTLYSRLEVEGGWYAILRAPQMHDDEELAIQLLEGKNVYIHPGHFYDFPNRNFLVLSLIARERDFAEGVRLLMQHSDS